MKPSRKKTTKTNTKRAKKRTPTGAVEQDANWPDEIVESVKAFRKPNESPVLRIRPEEADGEQRGSAIAKTQELDVVGDAPRGKFARLSNQVLRQELGDNPH